jgi:hypothetical protein
MVNALENRLQSVRLVEPQIYKNMAILPVVAPGDGTFQYRTLGEALSTWDVSITEVCEAGSVPELLVVNRGNKAILLVDGEELAGAKQNRVLNSSILLKELSETRIPVSCTEQGRWAYSSKAFSESGNVMAYKSRSRKTRSVHRSLEQLGMHKSDQAEVWESISELQTKASHQSPTCAMSDVYKAWELDLSKTDEVFRLIDNQVGLLALIGGVPVGFEMISLTGAYAKLHHKIVRSYTLEGTLQAKTQCSPGTTPEAIANAGRRFLEEIGAAEECRFPSVGHGQDFRYRTRGRSEAATAQSQSDLCGSALIHEGEVVHAAFFRLDQSGGKSIKPSPRWSE